MQDIAIAPLLRDLRADTKALHRQLDRAPLMRALLRRDLTVGPYLACLRRLHAAHTAIEDGIATWLAEVPALDLAARRKTPAIERDLAFFDALPDAPAPPFPVTGAAQAWGALYVIEGATLGGRVMSRHLARHAWFDGLRGREHFACYGSACAETWTGFRAGLLAAQKGSPARATAAIAGATDAFVAFHTAVFSDAEPCRATPLPPPASQGPEGLAPPSA